jgi:hypothetical protein
MESPGNITGHRDSDGNGARPGDEGRNRGEETAQGLIQTLGPRYGERSLRRAIAVTRIPTGGLEHRKRWIVSPNGNASSGTDASGGCPGRRLTRCAGWTVLHAEERSTIRAKGCITTSDWSTGSNPEAPGN